ncbi:hypothetical protein [Mesorhizobium sp. GbtcB19]|uniref:hypothetical protein n=1 Tax=Mesorhizobium sp. GbtcB19 TaxID=2824764 RepID=UPI001C30DEB8|nr:hypothetical protein [Mesorhizobium sp. GbtcB19]
MTDEATIKAAVDAVRAFYDVKISQLEARYDTVHGEVRKLAETVRKLQEEVRKKR